MVEQSITPAQTNTDQEQKWSTRYIATGIAACIGGMLIHLVVGSVYQWGIINIYVTSYYKTMDPSVTLESNAIAFPLTMLSMGMTMWLGIFLSERTHPLFTLTSCSVAFSASVFISSYMTNIWGFFVFYGILFGLLVGLIFMVPVIECNKYFPGKQMYVNGCILSGTGLGAVVFGMFSYTYLNPMKLRPLDGYYLGVPELQEVAIRVPTLLRYLALMYLCMSLFGVALMSPVILHNRKVRNQQLEKEKAKKQEDERNGVVELAQQQNVDVSQGFAKQAKTLKEAFCSKICWIEVVLVIVAACGLFLLNGNYKTYVKKTINDDEFLTIVGVVGAISNGLSRLLWNFVFLKTGYKFVMLCIISLQLIVLSTVSLTVSTPDTYLLMILIINSCLGGLLVTTPTVTQIIFGQRTGSNIYGFYWCMISTANFIQYIYVSNLSREIGFNNVIYICLGMAVVGVPIVLGTKFQGPWMNDTEKLEYCITCKKGEVLPEQNKDKQQTIRQQQHKSQLSLQVETGQLQDLKVAGQSKIKLEPISPATQPVGK